MRVSSNPYFPVYGSEKTGIPTYVTQCWSCILIEGSSKDLPKLRYPRKVLSKDCQWYFEVQSQTESGTQESRARFRG